MTVNSMLWGVETTAQQLAEAMMRSLPVTIASVALWDHPSCALAVKAVGTARPLPVPLPTGTRIPLAKAPWHRGVFEHDQPGFLERASATEVVFSEEIGLALVPDLQAIYLLPMRVGGETVGLLGLGEMRSRVREPFTEEKRHRCRAILDEFLTASAYAWEAGRLRRQIRAMASLLRTVKEVVGARSFEEVLACCTSEVAGWLGVPVRGVLFRVQPERGPEVVGRSNFPESVTEADGAQLLLALARGEGQWPVLVTKVAEDPLDPLHPATQRGETWTRVSLPLMKADRFVGVACLYVADDLCLVEWELEAFRRRAEIAAIGMEIVATLGGGATERPAGDVPLPSSRAMM